MYFFNVRQDIFLLGLLLLSNAFFCISAMNVSSKDHGLFFEVLQQKKNCLMVQADYFDISNSGWSQNKENGAFMEQVYQHLGFATLEYAELLTTIYDHYSSKQKGSDLSEKILKDLQGQLSSFLDEYQNYTVEQALQEEYKNYSLELGDARDKNARLKKNNIQKLYNKMSNLKDQMQGLSVEMQAAKDEKERLSDFNKEQLALNKNMQKLNEQLYSEAEANAEKLAQLRSELIEQANEKKKMEYDYKEKIRFLNKKEQATENFYGCVFIILFMPWFFYLFLCSK